MSWRTSSRQDIQPNTQDEPASPAVNQCHQARFRILQNIVWFLAQSQKKIPKLVLGKQANLNFFGYEEQPWFSKVAGPQRPTVPSQASVVSVPSALGGCESSCSHTRSTSLCQLKLEKETRIEVIPMRICFFFLFYKRRRQKNIHFGVTLMCAGCFVLPEISDLRDS